MEKVNAVLLFLEGRKALIASLLGIVVSYLVTDGTISAPLGTMLQSLIALLTGGALIAGRTEGFKEYKLGKLGKV